MSNAENSSKQQEKHHKKKKPYEFEIDDIVLRRASTPPPLKKRKESEVGETKSKLSAPLSSAFPIIPSKISYPTSMLNLAADRVRHSVPEPTAVTISDSSEDSSSSSSSASDTDATDSSDSPGDLESSSEELSLPPSSKERKRRQNDSNQEPPLDLANLPPSVRVMVQSVGWQIHQFGGTATEEEILERLSFMWRIIIAAHANSDALEVNKPRQRASIEEFSCLTDILFPFWSVRYFDRVSQAEKSEILEQCYAAYALSNGDEMLTPAKKATIQSKYINRKKTGRLSMENQLKVLVAAVVVALKIPDDRYPVSPLKLTVKHQKALLAQVVQHNHHKHNINSDFSFLGRELDVTKLSRAFDSFSPLCRAGLIDLLIKELKSHPKAEWEEFP